MTFLLLFVGTFLKHCSGEEGIFLIDFDYLTLKAPPIVCSRRQSKILLLFKINK